MSELQAGMQIELDDNMGTIQIVRKLGEGGQGYVYLVDYLAKQHPVTGAPRLIPVARCHHPYVLRYIWLHYETAPR